MSDLSERLSPSDGLSLAALSSRLAALEAAGFRSSGRSGNTQSPGRYEVRLGGSGAHGLIAGRVATWNGTTWIPAQPGTVTDASVLAYVLRVRNSYEAILVVWGIVDLAANPPASTVTNWTDYYLATNGTLTSTKPTTNPRLVLRAYGNQVAQVVPPAVAATTSAPSFTCLSIEGGNTVFAAVGSWSAIKGIKYVTATLTSLPAANPTLGATYADGLGYGYIINADNTIGALCWIANQNVGGGASVGTSQLSVIDKSQCLCTGPFPITGGSVYCLWRV